MTRISTEASEFVRDIQQLQGYFIQEHGVEDLMVRVVLNNGETSFFFGGLRTQASGGTGLCMLQAVEYPLRYVVVVRPADVFRVDFEIHVPQPESPKTPLGFSAGPRPGNVSAERLP